MINKKEIIKLTDFDISKLDVNQRRFPNPNFQIRKMKICKNNYGLSLQTRHYMYTITPPHPPFCLVSLPHPLISVMF